MAQQASVPVVGYLSSASSATYPTAYVAAFRQGLNEAGYAEGRSVTIEYRWAEDHYDRLPALAEELVRQRVDVLATTGGIVSAIAAKGATSTIPIVFAMGDDPVAAGVIASFAHPGGNLTGVSFFVIELGAKLLDLTVELVPNATPIAVFANPDRPSYKTVRQTMETAADARSRQLLILDARSATDFDPGFAALARAKAGALIVTSDPLFLDQRERLVRLAAERSIPTVYAWRAFVTTGGLMSYGINLADEYRTVGSYVGKILQGNKPADLPVQQPTSFELVINLKTAKALGLTVPPSLLTRADEVIE
jgi:putative ABC transport system substrate-binding protein